MDEFFSTIVTIITAVALWMVFRKMGRQGWEGIIPFYNTYVIFEELYGNGWKFLYLLIPVYNIYVFIKMWIDFAHAFNQSTGFGVGLVFLNVIFLSILAFGSQYRYRDGSRAVTESDFVSEAVGTVTAKGAEVYEDAKKKYEEAGGAEGIRDNISEKAKDFAQDAKEKFDDFKVEAKEKIDDMKDASDKDPIGDIEKLSKLKEQGAITEEEFQAKKAELLKKIK